MNALIYIIKQNKVTIDYMVHYYDKNDKSQSCVVRIDPRWASKNGMTNKMAVKLHVETKNLGFKRFAFETDEVVK